MINIYLAGPIEGCDNNEINDWRNKAKDDFLDGIKGINPYRAEEVGEMNSEKSKRIITKNFMDVKRCDGILAMLPKKINERRPSYGTTFEIAWGYMLQKPVWIITDDDFVRNHPLMKHSSMIFKEMDDAIDHINVIFGEYL